ncbi:MAG: hypothetical protein EA402_03170 [Planctomycetota bacterium]|nr:MAG: hypothetical protein EA402_03170 [Planctomycetota bacterium]
MPPRPRRRPAPQPESDDVNFEEDLDGTVDLSQFQSDDDAVDFEAEAFASAGDDDVDFESFADDQGADFSDEDFEEAAPASRRSSARSSARSSSRGRSARSERLAGASERKKAAKSQRKQVRQDLTPEEIEARRQARRSGLLLTLLMIAILGAGFGFYHFFLRTPPLVNEALAHLRQAQSQQQTLNLLINTGDDRAAEALIEEVVAQHLAIEMFGFASSPNPDPNNPNLVRADLAQNAFQLKEAFERRLPDIQRIRENRLARFHHDQLLARLSNLGPDREPDLAALRAAVDAFMDNPAYPESGPNLTLAARYRTQFVLPVRNRAIEIERERARRISAGTTDVVASANQETDLLMREGSYGAALQLVDDLARRHPQANLRPVREKVLTSARAAWESDRNRATNEIRIANDPGSSASDREAARERARSILHRVVSRFGEGVAGIDPFVQEARRMQQEFGL